MKKLIFLLVVLPKISFCQIKDSTFLSIHYNSDIGGKKLVCLYNNFFNIALKKEYERYLSNQKNYIDSLNRYNTHLVVVGTGGKRRGYRYKSFEEFSKENKSVIFYFDNNDSIKISLPWYLSGFNGGELLGYHLKYDGIWSRKGCQFFVYPMNDRRYRNKNDNNIPFNNIKYIKLLNGDNSLIINDSNLTKIFIDDYQQENLINEK